MREMKDSGIAWLGNIPTHWEVIYPKALFRLRKEKAKPGDRQLTASQQYGVIYQDEYMALTGSRVVTVEKDFDILKRVEKGDFAISMRSFQGGLEYSENAGSISSAYVMLVPNLEYVVPEFYKWALKSPTYITALQCTSNLIRDGQAMRYSNFVQVPLCVIPREEQKAIADLLNKECGKIDALIINQQAQIEKLKAYKQSLITEVVTKGLDLTAPMKDSGVEWAPHIPEDWSVLPIGRVMYEKKERTKTGAETPLSVTQAQGIILAENANASNPTSSYIDWRCVEPEDIVFNKYKAHSGVFFVSPLAGIVTFNYSVYKCYEGFVPKYFEYQFKTAGCISEFRMSMRGVGESISPLYTRELFRIFVLCPPKDVQDQIVNFLDSKFAQIDHLIAIKQAKIEKLEQYKRSLIYEYVTGKRDVI